MLSKILFAFFASVLFLPLTALAAIDGVVINRTGTPAPVANVAVTLVKPGSNGMQTLGTVRTDVAGRFQFEHDQPGGGPQLLQASFGGVNYNKLLTPNIPTKGVELDVYNSTSSPAVARVAERMLVIEPNASQLAVSDTVIVRNDGATTYNNDALGAVLFFLPPAANGQSRVNVQGPGGMPLPRAAEKTNQPNVYKVNFPIKPGQTEFEITYVLPAGSPFTFRSRVVSLPGMPAGPLRLIAPAGVTLEGADLEKTGVEPKTQATVYTVKAAGDFSADVAGSGSLRGTGNESNGADTSDQPEVRQALPRIYQHVSWLVAFALATLALGLLVLYRTSPVRSPYGK